MHNFRIVGFHVCSLFCDPLPIFTYEFRIRALTTADFDHSELDAFKGA